jgi:hypothetical protein
MSAELSRGDSLDLLALGNLGQLIFTHHARQSAAPARYLVEPDRVLVHVMTTANNVSWRDGDVLTLSASAFDLDQRQGWNVSVTGRAHGVPYLGVGQDRPRAPWIPCGGGDLLEIATEVVDGERLGVQPRRDVCDQTPATPSREARGEGVVRGSKGGS